MAKQKKQVKELAIIPDGKDGRAITSPLNALIFKSPDDIINAGLAYFDKCAVEKKPITICGLALGLGFVSRQSLLNYEGRPEFAAAIKKLRLIVEESKEQALSGAYPTGSIFWLKNHGWRDSVDLSGAVGIFAAEQKKYEGEE